MNAFAVAVFRVLAENGDDPGYAWLVYLIGGIVLLAVLVLPRKLAKRSRMLDEPRAPGAREQHELRRSMDRLLVELQETAREINATIDTKMIALKRLIDEADAQIRRMKELRGEPTTPEPPAEEEPPAPETPEPELPLSEEAKRRLALEEEICRLKDQGKSILDIARLTDVPRGEVELILSLRHQKNAPRTREDE